jgi:hypothetical protein
MLKDSGLDAIEVNPARQPLSVKADFVTACFLFSTHQLTDSLGEDIEDGQRHVRPMRKTVTNCCAGIE